MTISRFAGKLYAARIACLSDSKPNWLGSAERSTISAARAVSTLALPAVRILGRNARDRQIRMIWP